MFSKSKGIIALFLVSCSIQAMELDKKSLMVPSRLGKVSVLYDGRDFLVRSDNGVHKVQRGLMDKELRGIDQKQLATMLALGSYVAVKKGDCMGSEYALSLQHRLKGGGATGAVVGCYVGKFLVHFAAHSAILVAGALTGPAAPATVASLEATFFTTIEAASNVGAIAGGIFGGTVTGPV
jgi:hypothetical protein